MLSFIITLIMLLYYALVNIKVDINRLMHIQCEAIRTLFLRTKYFIVNDCCNGNFLMNVRILGDAGCNETTAASGP